MAVRLYHLAVDAPDPHAPARFWAAVLDHRILYEGGWDDHRR
ncbi:MAG: hypothetical protein ACRDOO_03315 [Actinomadura sp.]